MLMTQTCYKPWELQTLTSLTAFIIHGGGDDRAPHSSICSTCDVIKVLQSEGLVLNTVPYLEYKQKRGTAQSLFLCTPGKHKHLCSACRREAMKNICLTCKDGRIITV